jgi:tetratricopeptide (TPR) repeat protein
MLTRALERARRRGDRPDERRQLAQRLIALTALGRWEELLNDARDLINRADDIWSAQTHVVLPVVLAARGDGEGLQALAQRLGASHGWSQVAHAETIARAIIERETGAPGGSLGEACEAARDLIEGGSSEIPALFAEAVDCAFGAGETRRVDELLAAVDELKPAQLLPLLDAEATRARARIALHRGDLDLADKHLRRTVGLFRELQTPFYLARAQLEYAELLARAGRAPDDLERLRDEARGVFEMLGAKPWLTRANALHTAVAA